MEKNIDRKLEILLVEDDPAACKDMIEVIDESDDFIIVGVTNNASKAIQYIEEFLPDVMILDLELHEGSGNGLTLLSELRNMALAKTPYILVTTNNSSAITYDTARQLGADFIMSKHQDGYSAKSIIDFLKIIRSAIRNKQNVAALQGVTTESPEHYKKRITRQIMTELNYVGINPKSIGYQYLIDAIIITIKRPTQNICGIIGQSHGKTGSSVERAMQNAINRAWKSSNIEDLLMHYTAKIDPERGNPTITEFICYYANKLKSDY